MNPHRPIPALFVTATDTDAGKTHITRALVAHCESRGVPCAALKPIETGAAPTPADATLLAAACGRPELAHAPGLCRLSAPLAPRSISLADPNTSQLDPAALCAATTALALPDTVGRTLVEGAGGLLVPLTREHDVLDLIATLSYPALLVAPNRLGVLSHVLAAVAAASARRLPLLAVLLNQIAPDPDLSTATNQAVLAERLAIPVLSFPYLPNSPPDALARAVDACGLAQLLVWP